MIFTGLHDPASRISVVRSEICQPNRIYMVKSREYIKDSREGETCMKLLEKLNKYIYKMILTDLDGPASRVSVVKSVTDQSTVFKHM